MPQTNIEALQDDRARHDRQVRCEAALRHLLLTLDPQVGDAVLDYQTLLVRAENVIAKELQSLEGAPRGTL